MKDGAKILNWKGKDLRNPQDIIRAEADIMSDVIVGNITPREARTIQREINERIKAVEVATKTLGLLATLNKLQKGGRKR